MLQRVSGKGWRKYSLHLHAMPGSKKDHKLVLQGENVKEISGESPLFSNPGDEVEVASFYFYA